MSQLAFASRVFSKTYHVLLLGGQLVPPGVLASPLNLHGVETFLHVGVEPISGSDEVAVLLSGPFTASFPPWFVLFFRLLFLHYFSVGIPVCIDVPDETVCVS